jgi:hypothetical protein
MESFVLITGASSGIGLELAKIFASKGHHLILAARREEQLQQLQLDLQIFNVQVRVYRADLSNMEEVDRLLHYIRSENIFIEILVNNAGFGDYGLFHERSWPRMAEMVDLNIKALTAFTRLLLPAMLEQKRGKILNVASIAGFAPGPTMAVYSATKAYVLHLSEAISNELKGTGVTVTALCPGPTTTGFQKAASWEDSRLVKGRSLPTAAEVARFGYEALMKAQRVAVHGWKNKAIVLSTRLAPRFVILKAVRFLQGRVK